MAYNGLLVDSPRINRLQPASPDQYPDYHFLMVASNLGAEWLFDAARAYWERFRPTVISDFAFLPLIPADRSVIVTVIARRDTIAQLGVDLAQSRPDAYLDSAVNDGFDDAKAVLNDRAQKGEPFGVPLSVPSPTEAGPMPAIPTPRLFPTNPPAGFITETPPSLTPVPPEDQPQPLSPTPGSVLSGG